MNTLAVLIPVHKKEYLTNAIQALETGGLSKDISVVFLINNMDGEAEALDEIKFFQERNADNLGQVLVEVGRSGMTIGYYRHILGILAQGVSLFSLFLDSDDTLHEGSLLKLVEFLNNNKERDWFRFDKLNTELKDISKEENKGIPSENTSIYKTDLLSSVGFHPWFMKRMEDCLLNLKLAFKRVNIYRIDFPVVLTVEKEDSLSNTQTFTEDEFMEIVTHIADYIGKNNISMTKLYSGLDTLSSLAFKIENLNKLGFREDLLYVAYLDNGVRKVLPYIKGHILTVPIQR